MSHFTVISSIGSYRTSLHPCRLLFRMKTKVQPSVNLIIPHYGLSLNTIGEVCAHYADYEYLVDVIGLLAGLSIDREYLKDGKVTKITVLELTDHT
ncbi:replication factor A protein, partial [Trifolium medium]|nr:replication factor A protein [Trifolium medium]